MLRLLPSLDHEMGTTHFVGSVGGTGFDVRFPELPIENPEKVALLKGGLFDPNSVSMELIARNVISASGGEIAAATIATVRPLNPYLALRGLFHARKQRSQSVYGAVGRTIEELNPKAILLGGQSEGGISVVDGAKHMHENKPHMLEGVELSILTSETPGVFGMLEYEGNVIEGFARLAINCIPDVLDMSQEELVHRLMSFSLKKHSPLEPLYALAEMIYLESINIEQLVHAIREQGIDINHIFRDKDVIPGAEEANGFSTVYQGRHTSALTKTGSREIVDSILNALNVERVKEKRVKYIRPRGTRPRIFRRLPKVA